MKTIFTKGVGALSGAFVVLAMLAAVAMYTVNVAGAELAGSIRLVVTAAGWSIGVILAALAVGAAGVAMFTILNHLEAWLKQRAERRAIENANDLRVVTGRIDEQILISDNRRNAAPFVAAHLPPADPFTARAWLEWNAMHSRPAARIEAPKVAGQLGAGLVWPSRVNLFDHLTAGRGDLNKIILGETVDAESGRLRPVTVPLEDMVHVAGGGETGTGKSSLAYSLVYQIATAPQPARLVLADPAGTTWKTFAGHERLMYPLVSDEAALLHVLGELLAECEHRTEQLFAPYPTVEKLSEYNALVDEADRLDYIVMAIDEFPEYMESKPIQASFRRLIRKSRKAGIFLFALGTSWKATDMDSSIKRQFRTKVHFAASEPESSRVLLSDPRAADLRAPGRAYARLPFGQSVALLELQCAYVDKADVMGQLERPSILALPVGTVGDNAALIGESAVVDAFQDGQSLNECYRIFHKVTTGQPWPAGKRLGSQHTELIKDILQRNGIDPESA